MKPEINIYTVLVILFIHWLSDFVLQTDKMAQGKSKNMGDLLDHIIVYTICWIPFVMAIWRVYHCQEILLFLPITFLTHGIIDYYTSRVNASLWIDKKVHGFFVSVGFDQLLHFTQLLLTYQLLTQ